MSWIAFINNNVRTHFREPHQQQHYQNSSWQRRPRRRTNNERTKRCRSRYLVAPHTYSCPVCKQYAHPPILPDHHHPAGCYSCYLHQTPFKIEWLTVKLVNLNQLMRVFKNRLRLWQKQFYFLHPWIVDSHQRK